MKNRHKNQRGFSHHFILPVLAFIAVGAVGAYVIAKSNAATAGPSDVIYGINPESGREKYYRYSSSTGQSTEYSEDVVDILDTSQNQQWTLQQGNDSDRNSVFALSTAGERVSYGDLKYYYSYQYADKSCDADAIVTKNFFFSKANANSTSAPKLFYIEGAVPCENGKLNTNKKAPYMVLYSVAPGGGNKTAIYTFKNFKSSFNFGAQIIAVATNDTIQIYGENGSEKDLRMYIISSKGKLLFKGPKNELIFYLSENGKKITYTRTNTSTKKVYVADANGKKAKKVMSYKDTRMVTGISPTGTYIIYTKNLSKDGKKAGLYSLKVSNKKSYAIDNAYDSQYGPDAMRSTAWLPGSNTLVYVKQDAKAKTAQIIQTSATGSGKKVLVSAPYSTTRWMTIY